MAGPGFKATATVFALAACAPAVQAGTTTSGATTSGATTSTTTTTVTTTTGTTPAATPPAIAQAKAIQVSVAHPITILGGAARPGVAGAGAAQPAATHDGWSGRGEAGIVLSQGNAQSSTVSLKLDVAKRRAQWQHSLQVAALRATAKGTENTAHFVAAGQSDLQIRRHAFWFGGLRYESDRFSGFHYQESASTGAGFRFRDTELLKLSAQVGAGYRRLSDRSTDFVFTDTVAVAGLDYEQKLGRNTHLVNRAHAESGRYNTLASNYTGVEVQMNDKLGLSAGYDLRHNSEPPPGLKPDDAVSTVHLVYAF